MPRRQRVPRLVRLLVAARAVNQLGAFSLAFLTVLLCRVLGASIAAAGLVTAAFGLATIPSRLLGGWLAGRLGRRRTILTGLIGCAGAQLGIATAHDLAAAAAFAVLLGLAFELYEPPSQAMIADATAPDERAAAYGLLTMALSVGNMGAGLVAAAVGSENLRWLFVVDASSCLGCALIVCLAVPADPPRAKGKRRATVRGPSPWRDPALLAMTASGTVFALIYMVILVALPLSLAAEGSNPASAGLVMAASTLTLVLARPLQRVSLSDQKAFAIGFLLMAAGLAGYAMARSLGAFFAPTVALSIGNLLLMSRAFAVVAGLAPSYDTARYLAIYGLSWGVATVAAPVLATQVIGSFGPGALWAACSALCLVAAVVQPCLLRFVSGRTTSG
jgi:MFS family permease